MNPKITKTEADQLRLNYERENRITAIIARSCAPAHPPVNAFDKTPRFSDGAPVTFAEVNKRLHYMVLSSVPYDIMEAGRTMYAVEKSVAAE